MTEDKQEAEKSNPRTKQLLIVGVIATLVLICGLAGFVLFFWPGGLTGVMLSFWPVKHVLSGPVQTNYTSPECTTDDQCPAGAYCSRYGACLAPQCGDGICSPKENLNGSCPRDCGCPTGRVLNAYLNQCQQGVNVSSDTVNTVINNYLTQHNITGTATDIHDTYYGNQTVKSVFIDCREPMRTTMSCGIVLFIDNNGTIIEVLRTT